MKTFKISNWQRRCRGNYDANFAGVEEKVSKAGDDYLRWTFGVRTDGTEREVTGVSSIKTGPSSKAYGWLSGILGRKPAPDEEIDAESMIGNRCLVVVEVNDDGFGNVTDVLPPHRPLSDAAVAAYAAEADAELDGLPF